MALSWLLTSAKSDFGQLVLAALTTTDFNKLNFQTQSSIISKTFFYHSVGSFITFLFFSARHRAGITVLKMAAPPAEVLARVGDAKTLDGLSDDDLKAVLKEYYER